MLRVADAPSSNSPKPTVRDFVGLGFGRVPDFKLLGFENFLVKVLKFDRLELGLRRFLVFVCL